MKNMLNRYVCAGISFSFFIVMASWKLTNASLWFDETVEFYYSISSFSEMYEKIVTTFQPPLYNVVMHFWLKISENEWWFRFSGIFFGFCGSIALYKGFLSLNRPYTASIAVVVFGVSYRLIYYLQECAEYSLLIGLLFVNLYFFIKIFEIPSCKNLLLFTIFCILSVYTQYGAVFVAIPCACALIIYFFQHKMWQQLKILCLLYISALALCGIPLIYFFVIPQMTRQGSISGATNKFSISIGDMLNQLRTVFQYIFIGYFENTLDILITVCLILLAALIAGCFILGRYSVYRYLIVVGACSYLLFYLAVQLGFYGVNSYTINSFENRYCIFLGPLFLLIVVFTVTEIREIVVNRCHEDFMSKCFMGIYGAICLLTVLFVAQGIQKISVNWSKEDARGMTNSWYSNKAYEENTFVYYGAEMGFQYYFEHHEDFVDSYKEHITYQPWSRGMSIEELRNSLLETYNYKIPDKLFVCATHTRSDLNDMLNIFEQWGYMVEVRFQGRDAYLYYVSK